jgi:hypothetical protein
VQFAKAPGLVSGSHLPPSRVEKRSLRRLSYDAVSAGDFHRTANDCWTTARLQQDRANTAPTPMAAHSGTVLLLSRITRLGGRRDPDTSPGALEASPRPGSALTLARAARRMVRRRDLAARDSRIPGKRAGGAPAALARSTRTPYRLTLEGEQSAHQRSANPNQRGPRQLHRRERRFPARRQRERDAPCAATHSANNKRRFARCARRDGMHGRATCD